MPKKKIVITGKVPKPVNRELGKALIQSRPRHYTKSRKTELEKFEQSFKPLDEWKDDE